MLLTCLSTTTLVIVLCASMASTQQRGRPRVSIVLPESTLQTMGSWNRRTMRKTTARYARLANTPLLEPVPAKCVPPGNIWQMKPVLLVNMILLKTACNVQVVLIRLVVRPRVTSVRRELIFRRGGLHGK